jgi:hypothetical protein
MEYGIYVQDGKHRIVENKAKYLGKLYEWRKYLLCDAQSLVKLTQILDSTDKMPKFH